MEIKAVRGMHDHYGADLLRWTYVENRIKEILRSFGYAEIRTPVLEKIEVFSQTVGEDTDIVEKQMYQVAGDVSEKLVLRPEGTASFMRAVIEHGLHQSGQAQRFYYYLPMFRHERPQKGRLRQFHQFGGEFIHDASPEADAEIIFLLDFIYRDLGISAYEIRVNSVGCRNCRPAYHQILKAFFEPHRAELCEQCQKRLDRAPMRIMDCKSESCQALAAKAPPLRDHLCADCLNHRAGFLKAAKELKLNIIEDPRIVRGLDYYIRTAFEFTSDLLGAQSALVGGGRYDGLAERFGEKTFPAVGFGLGMERLMMALEASDALPKASLAPKIFFAPVGETAFDRLYPISFRLKTKGLAVEMAYDRSKGLKWLLKHGDRLGAAFVLILGETEIQQGKALLKNMQQGTQELLDLNQLETELLKYL